MKQQLSVAVKLLWILSKAVRVKLLWNASETIMKYLWSCCEAEWSNSEVQEKCMWCYCEDTEKY